MSDSQEVTCPACAHKHFIEMELANIFHQRNAELEDAFRSIMIQCLKHVPLKSKAELKKAKP